ncbi:nucleotide pyrophosphohydrolase [Alicyclobacillus vulcanalis]|uniref:NTP pyrophosphatase, house-cleaning of non-canonical NTPs n=1 Tax=Alicyclobacillus vulcanalis TaxID=252246 RepID=A0A1N7NE99_9BACL|nr:nucleotide pyrophosphohydrolase [Alicyclobacillus vulcanalis]SIS96674.1 NTP pyrophosphatase, house-cleaning of non-canonical NTPs [Alicyclobacillus vulcanalis]
MHLSEMQKEVDGYIAQFQEGYFQPMTLVVRLAEELGELAREVNHHYGEKPKKPDEPEGDIALEMGDILFVVACLANRLGIDLEEAFAATMNKFRTRDRNRWTPRAGRDDLDEGGRANG